MVAPLWLHHKGILFFGSYLNQPGFDKRILSKVAKAYYTQLQKGDKYLELNPTIGLTFTDFVIFSEPPLESQVITDFIFLERHQKIPYSEEMRLVFVELPKFDKKLRQLKGMADKWIYFIKNVGHLKSIPKTLANDKDIKQALTIANAASLTPEEFEVQQKKLTWLSDQKTNLVRAEQAEREYAKALEKAAQAEAEKQATLEKAEVEKQAALEKAEVEKQAALEKAEVEKQAALEKAEVEKQAALEKAEVEKQAALEKAEAEKQQLEFEKQAALEKAEAEKQAALEKAEVEKQAALEKDAEKQAALEKVEAEKQQLEFEKQAALEKAEAEKQAALEKAEAEKQAALKTAEKAAQLQMAKQMLQANVDIAFIRQVTGLKKAEINQL